MITMKRRAQTPPAPTSASQSSAAISEGLAAACEALQSREEAVIAASHAYDAALDLGRDEALGARQALTEAEVDRDVARRAVEKIEIELGLVREQEAAQQRLAAYEEAQRLSEAAAEAFGRYPALAAAIADIIAEIAIAEKAVATANADLPSGFTRLPAVELTLRAGEGSAEHVISREEVEAWVEEGDAMPTKIGDEHIQITEPGRGIIEVQGMPRNSWPRVELRKFRRELFIPFVGAGHVKSLAETVALPGVYSFHVAFWKPIETFNGLISNDQVLHKAAELRAQARRIADRDPETRFIPMDRTRVKPVGPTKHPTVQFSPWG